MNPLQVAFRVDSSSLIGRGHLTRCLTLANELTRRGAVVRFVCREQPGDLIARAEAMGYPVARLPDAGDLPGLSQETDAQATLDQLQDVRPDLLVVDHYELDARWERALRGVASRLFVIDDLASREHDCDVLLDQNYLGAATADRYDGLVPAGCQLLLGPTYALLAPEYAGLRVLRPPRDGSVRRLLVFFGGGDQDGDTLRVLQALDCAELESLAVDVVTGGHSGNAAIERWVSGRPAATLYRGLDSLAPLIAQADLAIGAGGSTTWERACLGVPAVVATVAHNQQAIASALAQDGYQLLLGESRKLSAADWRAALISIVAQPQRLALIASRAATLTDGNGCLRVAEVVLRRAPALTLRDADSNDARLFFDWANDPAIRDMSFSSEPIEWAGHVRWLQAKLGDSRSRIYVALHNSEPVGQIRFEISDDVDAEVGVHTKPGLQGMGIGSQLIALGLVRLRESSAVATVHARIKPGNARSLRAFQRAGFVEADRQMVNGNECVHLVRKLQ